MSRTQPASEFELPSAGPGPDPYSLGTLAANESLVVLLFYHDCEWYDCRAQTKRASDRYQALGARWAVAGSVLRSAAERAERAEQCQQRLDLPHPLLADPDATVGDPHNQPGRLQFLGERVPLFGRLAAVAIVGTRSEPEGARTDRGRSRRDHPQRGDRPRRTRGGPGVSHRTRRRT